jgi:ADP-ribosyl-[dinitrogen reductase] hydrolase
MHTPKTSQSHPLQINVVVVGESGGIIGLTFCPGKKHTGLYAGAWNRDLQADLHAIQTFGATALVTLMESDELNKVGVPAPLLGERARELGLEWHHLPIKDVYIPDDRFEHAWGESGLRLRNILAAGGKIVVHCLGGLGRTGTVAGRLLVEFGDTPETAIARIRAARPRSIETTAQEEYVRRCQPVSSD